MAAPTLTFELGAGFARHLDAQDELASFREAFVIPEPDLISLSPT